MNVEDRLSDITADLVGLRENSLFLERLFSIESGQWVDVASLCSGLSEVKRQFEKSRKLSEAALQATWLDYPESVYGEGFCIIVFFSEGLHWSNVALYNKERFFAEIGNQTGSRPEFAHNLTCLPTPPFTGGTKGASLGPSAGRGVQANRQTDG